MEYQKVISFLDNTPYQPSLNLENKWVEINEDAHGRYNTNNQIKFKTKMLKSILFDYSDANILVKGIITIANMETAAAPNNREKSNI